MIRLYFYVEGATEKSFVWRVLRPHLATLGVMVIAAFEVATRKRPGEVVGRGGGRHYLPAKNELVRLLKRYHQPDVRFTTLFDLYALYSDFPGTDAANKQKNDPYKRVDTLEKAFQEDIGNRRLIPHIQLHEFEAMLFSDPEKFAAIYPNSEEATETLKAIATEAGSPELIDDGQHTSPSKRIAAAFPQYAGAKSADGVAIAEKITLPTIREKCPHFNRWLALLEQLGTEPV